MVSHVCVSDHAEPAGSASASYSQEHAGGGGGRLRFDERRGVWVLTRDSGEDTAAALTGDTARLRRQFPSAVSFGRETLTSAAKRCVCLGPVVAEVAGRAGAPPALAVWYAVSSEDTGNFGGVRLPSQRGVSRGTAFSFSCIFCSAVSDSCGACFHSKHTGMLPCSRCTCFGLKCSLLCAEAAAARIPAAARGVGGSWAAAAVGDGCCDGYGAGGAGGGCSRRGSGKSCGGFQRCCRGAAKEVPG